MRRLYLSARVAVLFAFCAFGCAQQKDEGTIRYELADQFGDPIKEAEMAIAQRDYHLVGVLRVVVVVPGINADYEELRTRFRIETIEGTSDVIIVNESNSFNEQAERYADAYNRRMFAELGCDMKEPMKPCAREM